MSSRGRVAIGRTEDDSMVPEELRQLFYSAIETQVVDETPEVVEREGPIKDEDTTGVSAGGPQGASPAEMTVGPQKIMMVPEDAEVTTNRWDGLRK